MQKPPIRRLIAGMLQSWFNLTEEEQRVVSVVIGILLLGLLTRWWYLTH